ncbi:hypothetical protein [Gordonia humi]|uniref:Uncharacterized protein n=1 Tax=Gordonia humi TaxID=686429 RepID=A0A840EQL7_9ACTN|nr:hypothetical protein [Gordonia humi]MBB4134002.1 hypothetical protein [Gordonia humi]
MNYGDLLFHDENPVGRVRKRMVRWVLLVVLALVMATGVVLWVVRVAEPGGGAPPWWVLVPGIAAWLLLLWGIFEFLGLLSAWRRVGWSVDVYERGVVESRFGTVRQAMPFSGGVIGQGRELFTSPRPDVGPGRLTAPWKGELKQAPFEIRAAAQAVLVREALTQLRSGQNVAFPGRRAGKPGITLTPDRLRLPDGQELALPRMRVQYSISSGDGSADRITDDPARADGFHILTDDDQGFHTEGGQVVAGLERRSPNLAVVREVLSILIDPDGHRRMYRAQRARQEQELA